MKAAGGTRKILFPMSREEATRALLLVGNEIAPTKQRAMPLTYVVLHGKTIVAGGLN